MAIVINIAKILKDKKEKDKNTLRQGTITKILKDAEKLKW